jgi:hypothetical protein
VVLNNTLKLKQIASTQVGFQTRGKLDESADGDYTILRAQDFDTLGRLHPDQATRFIDHGDIDPGKYIVSRGDILVQARGQQHLAYYIDEELDNTVASNAFYVIRVKPTSDTHPKYLAWWINQVMVQRYFEQEQGISTIPFISLGVLDNAPIILPEMHTQTIICALMDCWQKEQGLYAQLVMKKNQFIQAAAMQSIINTQEVK